ncbi:MAG: HEAT repeat domain-containing protein [Planctomycetota bacterium]
MLITNLPFRPLLLCFVAFGFGACATQPERTESEKQAEEDDWTDRERKDQETKDRQDDERVILQGLRDTLQNYTSLVNSPSSHRNESEEDRLRDYLVEVSENRYDLLVRIAQDTEHLFLREYAVGTLGFSERPEALGVLLQALLDEDPAVRANAVFGLAVRRDPKTPLKPLMRIVESAEEDESRRASAAWTLYQLQTALRDPSELIPFWEKQLQGTDTPETVVVQAIRGLGQTRDPKHREVIEQFADHPTPLIRMATAIAIGRMRDQESIPTLLSMLERASTEPNVRLTIRKALQEMAGRGVDFGEDLAEWRRYFQRGG